MSKIIKIAIYKDNQRTFEELDYDLYKSLLEYNMRKTKANNTNELLEIINNDNTTNISECCFKNLFNCLKRKVKKWMQ